MKRGQLSCRAQGSMQFMMTYGWAILVALVLASVLFYWGFFSPDKYLPERCLFGPGIGVCDDWQALEDTGTVKFILTNSFGYDINVTDIRLDITECPGPVRWGADGAESNADYHLPDSEELSVVINNCPYTSPGRTGEFVTIAYTRSGSNLQHTIAGEVLVVVQ